MVDKKIVKVNINKNVSKAEVGKSTAMPDTDYLASEKKNVVKKPRKLGLDEKGYVAPKSRGELYKELASEEENLSKDVIELAPPALRLIALLLDLGFMYGLILSAMKLSPLVKMLVDYFLNSYQLVFMFGEPVLVDITVGVSIFVLIMSFVIVPASFFNTSFGKKIMGLRVRGDGQFSLGLGQCLQRELIFKPLSIVLVVGFIMPFFDENKRSLHDRLAKTLVVKD